MNEYVATIPVPENPHPIRNGAGPRDWSPRGGA